MKKKKKKTTGNLDRAASANSKNGAVPTPPPLPEARIEIPPNKNAVIRILIVHQIPFIRDGLSAGLSHEPGFQIVSTARDTTDALDKAIAHSPDVIVVNTSPLDNHASSVGVLLKTCPTVRIVALGLPDSDKEILGCIEAGAIGYVMKDASFEDLIKVIRAVARGESVISPQYTALLCRRVATLRRLVQPAVLGGAPPLTLRQQEIVRLIVAGLQNKEIAVRLHIEPQTVKNHVHSVLQKIGVRNRYEVARYAQLASLV